MRTLLTHLALKDLKKKSPSIFGPAFGSVRKFRSPDRKQRLATTPSLFCILPQMLLTWGRELTQEENHREQTDINQHRATCRGMFGSQTTEVY